MKSSNTETNEILKKCENLIILHENMTSENRKTERKIKPPKKKALRVAPAETRLTVYRRLLVEQQVNSLGRKA